MVNNASPNLSSVSSRINLSGSPTEIALVEDPGHIDNPNSPTFRRAREAAMSLSQLSEVMRSLWGDMLDEEGMQETPKRVLKHWQAATAGLHRDPAEPLLKTFPCDSDEIVIEKGLNFSSLCEHHLLPFYGTAYVGYIPTGRVVGLSKIPRALDILAARPQLQERLTTQLAEVISAALEPEGVAVVLKASHSCMTVRGVLKPGSETVTSCMKGVFRDDPTARAEFMQLIQI